MTYEMIPQEMKQQNQWVCWKAVPDESRPGKVKKTPVNAKTGGFAQSNNPQTWCDFDTAVQQSPKYSGIGFMFDNGYFGVDIDNAQDDIADYKTGGENNIIAEFIHTLQSYSEYSQSGNGIHIICRGSLPPVGRRKQNVEMYSDGRFFIMTGNICSEYAEINECTERIKPLHEKYIGTGTAPTTGVIQTKTLSLSQSEVLELAAKSRQGKIFSDLYAGHWEDYFTSHSEADMSLCNMLAFWCRRDEDQIDAIFRSSGLMREKWDRKQSGSTYGALTVQKAVKSCQKIYEPPTEYTLSIGVKPPDKKKVYTLDDTGNAQRMKDLFGESIRYCYIDKSWLYYDGRRWKYDDTGEPKRMIDEMLGFLKTPEQIALYDDDDTVAREYQKHIKKSRSSASKGAALKETEHLVPIVPADLDTHKSLLNVPNGILDLRTGELSGHDPQKFITKIGYTEYTDHIDAPIWQQFLQDIFDGNDSLIRFIQKAVGYSLTGSTVEQCVFFCYGNGRNGKSTFLDIISNIMGEYAVNIQPETIMVKKQFGGATSDIARLKGARFVTSVEPNEGMRLDEGLLKQLTGGDRITARKLYGNEFEFSPEFKLWMGTNHKPIIRGTDLGIWRRIMLVPFTVQIPDHKVDKHLKYKLRKELPGILKWAVDGCLLWQKEGLDLPDIVKEATSEYQFEMDVISSFLDACCVPVGEIQASELYRAYRAWAQENGEYEGMSNTRFGREIAGKFKKVKHSGVFYYTKISLKPDCIPYSVSITN